MALYGALPGNDIGFMFEQAAGMLRQPADEVDADPVVMGTRGVSRIAGAVIERVSQEVIDRSGRQVLLVP